MKKNNMLPNSHWVIGLLFIISYLSISEAQAQPKQRRAQQKQEATQVKKKASSPSSSMSRRALSVISMEYSTISRVSA